MSHYFPANYDSQPSELITLPGEPCSFCCAEAVTDFCELDEAIEYGKRAEWAVEDPKGRKYCSSDCAVQMAIREAGHSQELLKLYDTLHAVADVSEAAWFQLGLIADLPIDDLRNTIVRFIEALGDVDDEAKWVSQSREVVK
jgi:hypothetical protein